jgi:hypothetical protein
LGEFAKSLGTARLGYLRFMAEGRAAGHQPQFYDVHDQRFLGMRDLLNKSENEFRAIGK